MDRAFKKARAFDRFRVRTRRAFFGLGLGAAMTGALGYWFGSRGGSAERGHDGVLAHPRLAIARRLAAASDQQLWRERYTFLAALEESGGDAASWVGVQRLGHLTLAQSDPDRRAMAERLLKTSARLPFEDDDAGLRSRLVEAAR